MLAKRTLEICHRALDDLKAKNIVSINIKQSSSFADFFLIASATSDRHASALADNVIDNLKKEQKMILGIEGKNNPSWVLIDCDDVIVNIMLEDTRDFYDLESLWGDPNQVFSSTYEV